MIQLELFDIFKYWIFFMIALSVHQYGHVKAAIMFGIKRYEKTSMNSINPFIHISVASMFTGLFFGIMWPKKVKFIPKVDSDISTQKQKFIFDLAGIIANLIVGFGILLVVFLLVVIARSYMDYSVYSFFSHDMRDLGLFNLYLALLNCLPIRGVDGYVITRAAFSKMNLDKKYIKIYHYVTYGLLSVILLFGLTRYDLYVYDGFLLLRELIMNVY